MKLLKKILRFGGITLALVVLAAGLFLAHTWYFKPVNINLFFGRTMAQFLLDSPEMLSSLHVLEPFGITGHNARLDDQSLAAGDTFFARMKAAEEVLQSYRDEDLSPGDLMSKQIADAVNAAMERLPEDLKTAIALREIDENVGDVRRLLCEVDAGNGVGLVLRFGELFSLGVGCAISQRIDCGALRVAFGLG